MTSARRVARRLRSRLASACRRPSSRRSWTTRSGWVWWPWQGAVVLRGVRADLGCPRAVRVAPFPCFNLDYVIGRRPKGAAMNVESILLEIDRIAGGRHADHTISDEMRRDPRTRRVFVAITWLLVVELVLGTGALAVPVMLHLRGDAVPLVVWMRLVVVLAMTTTLFYFAWRAQRGYYWAYSRLRLC